MRIYYYDRNLGRMRSRYIHPRDRRSTQILKIIQPRRANLHPLDLLYELIYKLVGLVPWIFGQLIPIVKWSDPIADDIRPDKSKFSPMSHY